MVFINVRFQTSVFIRQALHLARFLERHSEEGRGSREELKVEFIETSSCLRRHVNCTVGTVSGDQRYTKQRMGLRIEEAAGVLYRRKDVVVQERLSILQHFRQDSFADQNALASVRASA